MDTEMTDQELQALVNLTGLMPCDRLPKKDPDQEIKKFLIWVAVNINGATKRGESFVQFSDRDAAVPVPKCLMDKATPILERLGYEVAVHEGTATRMTVSGW